MGETKLLVLGSAGMAGHVVYDYLSLNPALQVIGVARTDSPWTDIKLDVSDFDALESMVREVEPALIVNCVGILVNGAENDVSNAILMNSFLPNYVSKIGADIGSKLLHISTDCVFSGFGDGNYTEDSLTDGATPYARTKALGEVRNERDLTIRTSIIGPEFKANGTGLLDWFFKQSGEVKGFSRVFWSGVTTLELARAIEHVISSDLSGLVHLCPNRKISKAELLRLFNKVWDRGLQIGEDSDYKSDKSLVSTRNDFSYVPSDYPEMLEQLKAWMSDRQTLYPHYVEL